MSIEITALPKDFCKSDCPKMDLQLDKRKMTYHTDNKIVATKKYSNYVLH